MKEIIERNIFSVLKELHEDFQKPELENITIDTPLFGPNGCLDSINLVVFIAELEQVISVELHKVIILANEKAMSQKISPFRSIRSLTAYIEKLLTE